MTAKPMDVLNFLNVLYNHQTFSLVSRRSFWTSSWRQAMTTSLASNYDLKSTMDGVFCKGMVWVPRSVLATSIVIISSVIGKSLLGVALTIGTSLIFWRSACSIRTVGWLSSLRTYCWSCNALRAHWSLGTIFTLFGPVPSKSLSSSDSLNIYATVEELEPPFLSMSCSLGI